MEIEMHHLLLKTGVVTGACALAFLAAPGPAKAASPFALDEATSLVVPVVDQENLSVEEDLVPDEVPPGSDAGEMTEKPAMGQPAEMKKGGSSGNTEDEMIDKIGPGAGAE
jgi:hypothetical protein